MTTTPIPSPTPSVAVGVDRVRWCGRFRGCRGAVVVELPLIVVTFALMLWLGYGAMRLVAVNGDVEAAAAAAARAASGSYSPGAGAAQASAVASDMLASDASQRCSSVSTSLGGSFAPGGQVSATVTCVVPLSEVTGVGFPGSKTYTATAVDVVEVVRGGS